MCANWFEPADHHLAHSGPFRCIRVDGEFADPVGSIRLPAGPFGSHWLHGRVRGLRAPFCPSKTGVGSRPSKAPPRYI